MTPSVVITGVCGGIGAATATYFHERGWQVIGLDKRAECQADSVSRFVSVDLSDPAGVAAAFDELLRHVERVDALVNNAAAQFVKPLLATKPDEWDAVMASNVRSALLCTQHLHAAMREAGGSIVNVASVHAIATSEGKGAYAASKGALVAITRTLALELAPDDIRVNAILPGAVDTPMLRPTASEEDHSEGLKRLIERTPMGRVADPVEIASVIHFLASSESSYMTGQTVAADGGVLSRLATE